MSFSSILIRADVRHIDLAVVRNGDVCLGLPTRCDEREDACTAKIIVALIVAPASGSDGDGVESCEWCEAATDSQVFDDPLGLELISIALVTQLDEGFAYIGLAF